MATIADLVESLERKRSDLQSALGVATNERTGREGSLRAQIADIDGQIARLQPLVEPVAPTGGGHMDPCTNCGRPFWPESLEGGRCGQCAAEREG